jgi:hypothetical protein
LDERIARVVLDNKVVLVACFNHSLAHGAGSRVAGGLGRGRGRGCLCSRRWSCSGCTWYADAVICFSLDATAGRANSWVPSDKIVIREGSVLCYDRIASVVGDGEVEAGTSVDETGLGGAGLLDAGGCGRGRWLDRWCSRHADAVVGLSPDATTCWSDCGVPFYEILICEGAIFSNNDLTLVVGFGEVEVSIGLNQAGLRGTGLLDASGCWLDDCGWDGATGFLARGPRKAVVDFNAI